MQHFMQQMNRCKYQVGVVRFQDDVREMLLVVLQHNVHIVEDQQHFTKRK